jgi:hypothetical protein
MLKPRFTIKNGDFYLPGGPFLFGGTGIELNIIRPFKVEVVDEVVGESAQKYGYLTSGVRLLIMLISKERSRCRSD